MVICSGRQSEWTLILTVLPSMLNEVYSSCIYDEWAMSSYAIVRVHHVPCFISYLNSSLDLLRLNWEFPIGVSLAKYPISTIMSFSSINKLDSMSNLIKEGILT
jgi:hypothetical protein